MDAKLITPFVDAIFHVLPQLGFVSVQKGGLKLKEEMVADSGVTALIGLTKKVKGNVAYCMTEHTACNIASKMMMGMPVDQFDGMAQSAVAEMANMLSGTAAIHMEKTGLAIDILPPRLLYGDETKCTISSVKTLVVEILTEVGSIEVNVGIECYI